MKINPGKISTLVLWIGMTITMGIFANFYFNYIQNSEQMDIPPTDRLLNWLFIVLFIVFFATIAGSVYSLIQKKKEPLQKRMQPFLWSFVTAVLLFFTYQAGDGAPLSILGYDGSENTYHWLKIIDMWIYSIYALLVCLVLVLVTGIIWSYFKKR